MNQRTLNLEVLPLTLAVYRLPADAAIPAWATGSVFLSITRTTDELSIVCADTTELPQDTKVERGWRCFKVKGPLDFRMGRFESSTKSTQY